MEDLKTVARVYEKDDFAVTFDLKSSCHHIAIAPEYHTYLGFKWCRPDGKEETFSVCYRLACQRHLSCSLS